MIPTPYVWFTWSAVLLLVWALLFAALPRDRPKMWRISLATMPFGLTEPLFVPRYWNPPSLFDLAAKTRFDLESLIFSFVIAGICAVLYDLLTGRSEVVLEMPLRRLAHHRFHVLALFAPAIVFVATVWFPWNPIYPAIVAMLAGALATTWCRPDLAKRTWAGGLLFTLFYAFVLQGMRFTSPWYIEKVWNLTALSGFAPLGMPIEELLFAAAFGIFWSGIYEHLTWRSDAIDPVPDEVSRPA